MYCRVQTTNYSALRNQNTLTLSSEIVQKSAFSDTAYYSAYVIEGQNLIAKSTLKNLLKL